MPALRHQRQTRGLRWSLAAARAELRRTAAGAGVRRRFAPHQLRPAHAVETAREGVPLILIIVERRPVAKPFGERFAIAIAAAHRYALTILNAPDVPFKPDAIRDDGRREWMSERLRERVGPHLEVAGPHEDRLSAAIAAIGKTVGR